MPNGRFRMTTWCRWSVPSASSLPGARRPVPGFRVLVLFLLVPLIGGCGDRSRTMSPQETLAYKRELLVSNPNQLSQVQIERLGRHPARTKAELDKVYARLRQEFDAQKAADRARYDKMRKEEEEAKKKAEAEKKAS
jgi:hypothetical protein